MIDSVGPRTRILVRPRPPPLARLGRAAGVRRRPLKARPQAHRWNEQGQLDGLRGPVHVRVVADDLPVERHVDDVDVVVEVPVISFKP